MANIERAPYRVIDADGHVTEPPSAYEAWAERLPETLQHLAPRWYTQNGNRVFVIEGKVYPPHGDRDHGMSGLRKSPDMWTHREGDHDPHKRMPDMDHMGIDISVLFGSNTSVQTVVESPDLAAAISSAYNEWIAEYCHPYPDKLKGVALVPIQDPVRAATELERGVKLGLVGCLFPPLHAGKMPDHPYYFPLYQMAQDLDVPICIHNSSAMNPARHLFNNFVLRHAYSTAPLQMAMGSIIIGGILDSFPKLRFAFLEAGAGWVPYVLERLQARYELLPHWSTHLKQTPEEYVATGNLFFSLDPDEKTLPAVADTIGGDRLIMGSDYSHWDGTAPESIRLLLNRSDIPEELKKKILSDNPARLYKL